ncbi:MAG: RES domain-containing protein [Pseudomonadota bacterium]
MLYPSTRRDGGRCLVAFRPHLVQNVRQGDTWNFEWKGDASPEITRS